MAKNNNSEINKNLIHYINTISNTDFQFLAIAKSVLTITRICEILIINRNKYNYLVRNNQLDIELLKLRG